MWERSRRDYYRQGQRDERERIRAAVVQFGRFTISTPKRMSDGIVSVVLVDVTDALLAVIDAPAPQDEPTFVADLRCLNCEHTFSHHNLSMTGCGGYVVYCPCTEFAGGEFIGAAAPQDEERTP